MSSLTPNSTIDLKRGQYAMFELQDKQTKVVMVSDGTGPVNMVRIFLPGTPVSPVTFQGIDPAKTMYYQSKCYQKQEVGLVSDIFGPFPLKNHRVEVSL